MEHTLNFGDESMNVVAKKSPNKSIVSRLTPIKQKINTMIYVRQIPLFNIMTIKIILKFNNMMEASEVREYQGKFQMIIEKIHKIR